MLPPIKGDTMNQMHIDQIETYANTTCNHEPEIVMITIGKEIMYCAVCRQCKGKGGLRVSEEAATKAWNLKRR